MMAGRVDEEQSRNLELGAEARAAEILDDLQGDLCGTDVLGDQARLALGHSSASNLV
jgi:hypothetical protein